MLSQSTGLKAKHGFQRIRQKKKKEREQKQIIWYRSQIFSLFINNLKIASIEGKLKKKKNQKTKQKLKKQIKQHRPETWLSVEFDRIFSSYLSHRQSSLVSHWGGSTGVSRNTTALTYGSYFPQAFEVCSSDYWLTHGFTEKKIIFEGDRQCSAVLSLSVTFLSGSTRRQRYGFLKLSRFPGASWYCC